MLRATDGGRTHDRGVTVRPATPLLPHGTECIQAGLTAQGARIDAETTQATTDERRTDVRSLLVAVDVQARGLEMAVFA